MIKRLYILCLFLGIVSEAQQKVIPAVTIPIEVLEDKYLFFKAKVNEGEEMTFYFDTGATTSLIDKNSAQKLGIVPNYEQAVAGAGGKIKYEIASNQIFKVGEVSIDSVDFVLEDLSRLQKSIDRKFDGIVGYALIKQFLTEVDLENGVINLYPKQAKLNTEAYKKLPFSFGNNIPIPQVEVEMTLKNNKHFKGTVFFDSGAGLSLLVNTPFKEEHQLLKNVAKQLTSTSENLSKTSEAQMIAIKNLNFANYSFKTLSITLSSDKAGVSSFKGYLGILGAEIINRFNFILDYEKKIIYLKPNKLFNTPFFITLSGITLRKDSKGVYIFKISKDSPAYIKGLRPGDRVESIQRDTSQNLEKYKKYLKQKGKKLKIKVKDKKSISITLKELL